MTTVARTFFPSLLIILLGVNGCVETAGAPRRTRLSTPPRERDRATRAPFFDAREHEAEYHGPGREVPPPDTIEEVKIGWYGPSDPKHATGGQMWMAATLVIEEANREGGYNGRPFRLLASWSRNPWGTGVRDATRLVYDERVWAMVGAPDGPSAHLIEQIVAKACLSFVSPVSTDKTANLANVPWIFSCVPDDHFLASTLAKALALRARDKKLMLVSCTDHDSRAFTTELRAALAGSGIFPARHLEFNSGGIDGDRLSVSIRETRPDVIALIAGPLDASVVLSTMRRAGLHVPVFGGPAMNFRSFADTAGEDAGSVVFPLLWDASAAAEPSTAFVRRFKERFGVEPDFTAAYTYDGVNLLIAAIRRAGLNRARIRDAIRELAPFPGVSGPITWDPTGRNNRPVPLGTIRDGLAVPVSR